MKVLVHEDARGRLESLCDLPFHAQEVLVVENKKGTLKGLHVSPYRKIVYVRHGKVHDFFAEDPPFGRIVETTLGTGQWILVPANAGHGFYCEEDSLVLYFLEHKYDPEKDRTIYWASPEFGFQHAFLRTVLPIPPLILSPSDTAAAYAIKYEYVVLGARGFIGSHVVSVLRGMGRKVLACDLRLHDDNGIGDVLKRSQARYVICCAGISGKPTIQWSETHDTETFETNMLDACNLIRLCHRMGKHLTYFGSGLVYAFREGARTESELPDWTGRVYCRYRVMLEEVIRHAYAAHQLLYLRVLYPCAFDGSASCFFEKMLARVHNVNASRVSLTILPDLLPLLPDMIEVKKLTGILNFVNPGSITLSELLHAANVDHCLSFSAANPRVSEVLDTTTLLGVVGDVSDVRESATRHFKLQNRP